MQTKIHGRYTIHKAVVTYFIYDHNLGKRLPNTYWKRKEAKLLP